VTPWTVACQALLSMGFSQQAYRIGLPFPSPRDLPDPGIKPVTSAWQVDSLPTEPLGKLSFHFRCLSTHKAAYMHIVVVQSLICVQLFANPWTAACQASLSFTISQSLLKLMSLESVMPSNRFILCHPLLLLPSIFPSIRVFPSESALRIRWPKYWSFSFSISPTNEYSGLISFRIDWFDLLAVQGTHKSLLQHHSSKASIFCHSAFFMVQLGLVKHLQAFPSFS